MLEWPIIVDESIRDRLVDRVTSRRARVQLVCGPSGIGKSTLTASVAARLEATGHTILPIVGMPELRDVPLGAMAPLLAHTDAPVTESAADRLQRLFALVASAGAKQVLVVDDGPLLDDITASTIFQLVRVYGVSCVMTARTEHPLTGPLHRLHDEGFVETTELDGLRVPVARRLVQIALEDAVEPQSLRSIVERAGGNPLFLRELVLAVARSGTVTRGRVGLIVDATTLPERLRDTIAQRFRGLAAEERTVAELIAVAEPFPPRLLTESGLVEQLDRAGLIARAADGELFLAHPLFAETLIELMTDQQRDDRRIDAARRLLLSDRADHRFQALCLLAETTAPPPPAELAWAASYAHTVDDHALALRLTARSLDRAAALGEPPLFEALLVRADALAVSGLPEDADAAFVEAERAAQTDDDRANAATRHGFHLAVQRQRPRDAVAMGAAAISSMAESPARAYLAANLAKWRLMAGEPPEADPDPTGQPDAISAEPADPVTTFNADLYRMIAAAVAGDIVTARAAITAGRPHAEAARSVIRHGVELLDFADFFVVALQNGVDDAIELARRKRGEFFEESVGMWNYGIALFTLHSGATAEALEFATAAEEQLTWRDFLGARGAATALRATAAAQLGDRGRAVDILATIDADARAYVVTELQVAEAEAWLHIRSGDEAAAVAVLSAAVDHGIDSRYFAFAALSASVAVQLGRADAVLDRLRRIGALADGALVAALVAHAEASAVGEATPLLDAADQLSRVGLRAAAAAAARQAARAAGQTGDHALARRASLRASALGSGLSGWAPRDPDPAESALSDREWAIASAAAGRERSKEIAARLGLSARTVDNHLANIYRKLGASGRDDLRRELEAMGGLTGQTTSRSDDSSRP